MSAKIGIVIIGYNRLNNIKRLLSLLEECDFEGDEVTLVISLDNSGDSALPEFAKQYYWPYGLKVLKTFPQRLGLKQHVITCGSYIDEFNLDAIAVFEDDIMPSKSFYNYTKQAVEYYQDDMSIAGISLYKHLWNVTAGVPFEPIENGNSDVYFMQFAQSWGQVWLKNQWRMFINWYESNAEYVVSDNIPEAVNRWPKTSWLKYHTKYCIEQNKYFVYPYKSLTTCCSDVGEHALIKSTTYQVPIELGKNRKYCFSNINEDTVRYDAFFELVNLKEYYRLKGMNVSVNINGAKTTNFENADYILMLIDKESVSGFDVVETYGLEVKPLEMNLLLGMPGQSICLIAINKAYPKQVPQLKNKINESLENWLYFNKEIPSWRALKNIILFKMGNNFQMIRRKITNKLTR